MAVKCCHCGASGSLTPWDNYRLACMACGVVLSKQESWNARCDIEMQRLQRHNFRDEIIEKEKQ